jgi:hypothetical protein
LSELRVRARDASDRDWVESFLVVIGDGDCEILTLHAAEPWSPIRGISGTHLQDELELEKVPGA